ncbi:hypothetical protein Terro_4056 [Terriglobus roseus DSM 18391]|uniref:Uncharacterized protein n=1 Tax=Terriglobus roseus (strain DSM 18391 / NRRL B-41598 / KBS 63) TaxID=926566 RepID=I3ZLZ5_TERRK|nr:hypothetical protein [Terriglobus roseus]AFL90263.1 hypothetical protein Terro_4056 [Terriglobus roseus DSM 18391]
MARIVIRIIAGLLLLPVLFYAADWAVWRVRIARGNGMDEVAVTSVSIATLKRDREEYYFDGDITLACPRSVLPMLTDRGVMSPCWYLRRNHTVIKRY